MKNNVLLLSYSACSTCKSAVRWLNEHGIHFDVRPVVTDPPTTRELTEWIAKSGVDIRKWLNTSGQSYRRMGKVAFDEATDADIASWLSKDGKLVKRPVLIHRDKVLVGFKPDVWGAHFSETN